MLEMIGVAPGWRCIDLGCGAMGILGPLSRRAGPKGEVTGVDMDAKQLDAARAYVTGENLKNVKVLEQDAYNTKLPRESFDLTHVRFVFAPVGRDAGLLREMIALTRPGGTIAIQEPDAASWNSYPPNSSWMRLKEIILATFSAGGGDFNAGTRTFSMLRQAGLRDVRIRAPRLPLLDKKTHLRLPVQFATSLRKRIVEGKLATEAELDKLMAECERIVNDPDRFLHELYSDAGLGTAALIEPGPETRDQASLSLRARRAKQSP